MHEHRGPSIAVAAVATVFLCAFAGLVVALGWTGVSVYAIVKWVGRAPDDVNPVVIVLLFVGIVTFVTLGMAGAMWAVGRSMASRKRAEPAEPWS
ncbi:MAG: hypothetical protein ACXVQJ_00925 [Actinomycetota bacterium]